jgi:spermidine dehydrogenase
LKKPKKALDRELGMDRSITRRDFVNGVALGTAGLLAGPDWLSALALDADPQSRPGYYPPALTGLRGSHEGSDTAAHALRDGSFWKTAGAPVPTHEEYDLVVVGGGLSGLAAAHFFRKSAGPSAKVLILDNHDDFGGHAKRNEFRHGERTVLGFGGTWSIESPAPYSGVAKGLIAELGIDVPRLQKLMDYALYPSMGLGPAIFFDKETFGADRLVPDPTGGRRHRGGAGLSPEARWARFAKDAPLSDGAKRDFRRLFEEKIDVLPGLASAEKKARLARISYAKFLTEIAKLDAGIVPVLQARPHSLYGVGIDGVSALDAWGLHFPGFQGMGLDPTPGPGMGLDAIRSEEAEAFFFHFPDGNASIARLLVRSLVPGAIPGHTSDDVVTARADYARLDEAGSPVRIRLNSTAVRVRHEGEAAAARSVEVAYVQGGKLSTVRAKACVLACWHVVIPYICPELPEAQKQALASATKIPLLYTNVMIRNWTALEKLGVSDVYAPGSYHTSMALDMPVSLGGYQCARRPDEAVLLTLSKTPCSPGLPARDQHLAGRMELFTTSFEQMERNIRDQLGRTLGSGGFDPARDIEAITVNRWPHGYAYQYNSLFEPFWRDDQKDAQPCLVARRQHGRIAIANSDAAAYAYTDAAFDEAYRAVTELTAKKA